MKIVEVKSFLVGNVPPYRGGNCWMLVKLVTDNGIEGIGEWSTGNVGREDSQIRLVESLGKRFIIGADPFKIERLWQEIYAADHDYRHPGLSSTPALSAVEMACWDIVGKSLKQPIYNLLGGLYNDKLRAYSYMPDVDFQSPEKVGQVAAEMLRQGNTALKFDPFTPIGPGPRDFPLKSINHVAKILKAIRDAVGDEVEIGIETMGSSTPTVQSE